MKKLLAALLLFLPLMFVTEVQAEESGVEEEYLEQMAQDILDAMNKERKEAGLSALVWEEELTEAAYIRAQESSILFSHTRPDGSAWWTVNPQLDYAENLAYGFVSVDTVMAAWMNSISHRANILDGQLATCAIGIIMTDNGNLYYAVEFGM